MFKFLSANIMPKSLFINDVKTEFDPIGVGNPGLIFGGKYKGQSVALKVVGRGREPVSLLLISSSAAA